MAEGTGRGETLSIWFFVGAMSLIYGVVLLVYGAYAWLGNHELATVKYSQLHPTFWWGVLLTLLGGFYTLRFRPHRGDERKA